MHGESNKPKSATEFVSNERIRIFKWEQREPTKFLAVSRISYFNDDISIV